MPTIDGGPAFPTSSDESEFHYEFNGKRYVDFSGMSLRDYFAGQALPQCVALALTAATANPDAKETVAAWAYELADAMLAEREKKERR